jgi:hypothetical protein
VTDLRAVQADEELDQNACGAFSSRRLFDYQVVDKQTFRGRRKTTQQGVERWDVSEKPRVRKAIANNGLLLHQDQTSIAKEFELLGKYFRAFGQVKMLVIGKSLNCGQIGRRHRAPFQVYFTGRRQDFEAVVHAGIDPWLSHSPRSEDSSVLAADLFPSYSMSSEQNETATSIPSPDRKVRPPGQKAQQS